MTITRQDISDNMGWADVIRDAESEISKMQKKISRLKVAIRVFREKMRNDEPLPPGLKAIK